MLRLISIEIIKHTFFPPQKIEFVNDSELIGGPYISLLIGPNGTGKSQVLELIVEVFNILSASQEQKRKVQNFKHDFELKYLFNKKLVKVRSIGNSETFWLDGEQVSIMEIPLPNKILASAINLTDRFPNFTKRRKIYNERYEYLGIRSASNNAFINTHIKNLIDRLTSALAYQGNAQRFVSLFKHLGLKEEIGISLKAGARLTLDRKSIELPAYLTSEDKLHSHFSEYISKMKNQNRMTIRYENYSKIINDRENLRKILNFISEHRGLFERKRKGDIKYNIQIKFADTKSINQFLTESEALELLRDLELLVFDRLSLQRINAKYSFDQASSGEHHILSSFISMFATIKENSVVLIDEPEISLHPNWQIQYIRLLQTVFSDFKDCHFIISSHSHFLVTDLTPDKSSIVSFNFDNQGKVLNETLDYETLGWSPESILYSVFGVANMRNYYFENDIKRALSLISSNSPEIETLRKILGRLKQFSLPDNDPLQIVIDDIQYYIQNNEG